ncbi:MAG: L,D-transpeptidase family protein [Flavobacterium sp.]|nr:L,D-transpeptidase family protein [Flavobacterium sp.]
MRCKIIGLSIFTLGLFMLPVLACVDNTLKAEKPSAISEAAVTNVYSTFLVDSAAINMALKGLQITGFVKKQIATFYQQRGYQFAWISTNGLSISADNYYKQILNDSHAFADTTFACKQLDTFLASNKHDNPHFIAGNTQAQLLEVLTTATFFKYATVMYGGITNSAKNLEWHISRQPKDYVSFFNALSSAVSNIPKEPVSVAYNQLKRALLVYQHLQGQGGLPLIANHGKTFAVGDTNTCLVQVKASLLLTGDMAIKDTSAVFDSTLSKAVSHYQTRMGLAINGKLNTVTIAELNKPIGIYIKQILVNLERLRWLPATMESSFLLVNIPEYKLHIVADGKQLWATNVVVGKAARRTTIFRDNVSEIILNPYWNVPASITRNEIIPHINRNSAYLRNNNMEVMSQHPFTVRQKPGPNNSLGKMKFLFPNSYNIYLHDTPAKDLFDATKRAFSHGCIRVENPLRLAQYLLRNDTAMTVERINTILTTNAQYAIPLKPTMPVYIVYYTAWIDGTGQLIFRNDIYGFDEKLLATMAAKR